MTRVFALANQKGGVAKTTTVHNLAVALVDRGQRVLAVDLDPQSCLSYSVGLQPDSIELSLHDVLLDRCSAADAVEKVGDLHVLPANIDLAGTEVYLLSKTGREYVLKRSLSPLLGSYDTILIDCPPSLGILTINGLTAARQVLIPLQCETLGHRGVGQLMDTIGDVRAFTNPELEVRGVIATMFDPRTNLSRELLTDVPERWGIPVLDPPIPKSVKVAEAPRSGMSVLEHAPASRPAVAYRELARRMMEAEG